MCMLPAWGSLAACLSCMILGFCCDLFPIGFFEVERTFSVIAESTIRYTSNDQHQKVLDVVCIYRSLALLRRILMNGIPKA